MDDSFFAEDCGCETLLPIVFLRSSGELIVCIAVRRDVLAFNEDRDGDLTKVGWLSTKLV
jgi:hypothetical protein